MRKVLRGMLIGVLALLCANTALFAQDESTNDSFRGHWFITVQGGIGYTVGELNFEQLISPAATLGFGYQFTPVWGLRASVGGWEGRGIFVGNTMDLYRFNFLQGSVDVTADLCSIFAGYKRTRLFTPYLFAGIGVSGGFNNGAVAVFDGFVFRDYLWNRGDFVSPVGRFGVGTDIRICDAVDFNIEIGANFLDDRFNSKRGSAVDWQLNAQVGFKFNIGKKKSSSKSAAPAVAAAAASAAVSALAAESAESAEYSESAAAPTAVSAEQELYAKEAMSAASFAAGDKAEQIETKYDVFFLIGQYGIRDSEKGKIADIVRGMTYNPDVKVAITGHADYQTGSAKRNLYLSRKRAEAVAEALIAAGIDSSRIAVDYKGASENPYENSQDNRVAICSIW